MKRCPECRRDYYDDTLLYCLDDGNALLEGPASGKSEPPASAGGQTAIMHEYVSPSEAVTRAQIPTTEQTAALPSAVLGDAKSKRFDRRLFFAPLAIAVIVASGFAAYFYFSPAGSKQIESIAVMPFVNESGNEQVEYLSDGMTESLISGLSQLPDLSVKARSSVFRFKGKDATPKQIGQELNVQAILIGRVVQRGDELALHIELIDVATENVLWKGDYNRAMTNLVMLQSEIARDVSNRLRARLSGAEQEQATKKYTENAAAYQLYLKGRFHWNKRTPEEHTKAIQYFEQAIAIDPNYALAYAGLADCYAVDSSPAKGEERIAKLRAAAIKALELDPTLGQPHAALANVYWAAYEWDAAEREFKTAIELDPTYPTAHQWYAELLSRLGRHDEAIAGIKLARELDPLSLVINSDMIYILVNARRYEEAIEQGRKTIEMEASWITAYHLIVLAYEETGRFEEALSTIETSLKYTDLPADRKSLLVDHLASRREAVRESGAEGYWRVALEFEKQQSDSSPFYRACIHSYLNEKDEAFRWLNQALDENDSFVDLAKAAPSFDNLRSDPRWPILLKRMNLSP